MPRLLAAAAMLVALTACSGVGSTSAQPARQLLDAAKTSFDNAQFIRFTLSTSSLPPGVNGLLSATGTGTHAPAFTGQVKVRTSLDFEAPLVATNGKVYVKLPFSAWSTIDPAQYGAPDPATLMDRRAGISSLFTATTDPTVGTQSRQGSTVLTAVSGGLPGASVRRVFPSAGTSDFQVTFELTQDNLVDKVSITGPFYAGHPDVTYTISLDLHAAPVTITPPA